MPDTQLEKAIGHIHTPDSWARALVQAALKAQQENKPLPGFKITEHPECVQICVGTPFGTICVCV
jgi:hypothetical protein